MEDYRQAYSWQGAVAFASPLMRLCEELPVTEQFGLVAQVQAMAIDLPASIADDIANGTQTRFNVIRRVEAALAVIDRVYPALDATSLMEYIDSLRAQMTAEHLCDASDPAAEQPEEDDEDSEDGPRTIVLEAIDDV